MSPKKFPKRWTDEEEEELLREFSENITLKIISKNHERSEPAILARFKIISPDKKIDNSSNQSNSSNSSDSSNQSNLSNKSNSTYSNDNKNLKKIMEEIKFLKIRNKELEQNMINLQIMFNNFSIYCENNFSDLESSIENIDNKI